MERRVILNLIQYIVWYATEKSISLTTIRLVKLLYLSDYYWAQYNNGETYTGWPWRFHHYGPYCYESLEAIEEATKKGYIEKIKYESKFDNDYNLFKCFKEPENLPPTILRGKLEEAVDKWGDNTYELLDYVYFDTEPMIKAKKGEHLNFSGITYPKKIKQLKTKKLSKENIKKGKEIINKLKKKIKPTVSGPKPIYDELYYKAVKLLDDEDLTGELSGEPLLIDYNEH